MRVGLNIPTTYRIAAELLEQIAAFGFDHVRTDVPPEGDLREFVTDYSRGPRPLFILHDVARNEPLLNVALGIGSDWFDLCPFNQDLDNVSLDVHVQGVRAVQRDARARGFDGEIVIGATADPRDYNRAFIEQLVVQLADLDDPKVVVDEHRYPYQTQDDWTRPWPPFESRAEESADLIRLANGLKVAHTEMGWHTAVERIGGWLFGHNFQLTDEQCRDNYVKEFTAYDAAGIDRVTVFQLNDGAGSGYGSKQGIRRLDGTWKPQADAVRIWRGLRGSRDSNRLTA